MQKKKIIASSLRSSLKEAINVFPLSLTIVKLPAHREDIRKGEIFLEKIF